MQKYNNKFINSKNYKKQIKILDNSTVSLMGNYTPPNKCVCTES